MRSKLVAYLLWLFLPPTGAHRFYTGHVGTGFLYLFTLALFGIGWFVDLFLIPGLVREANEEYLAAGRGYPFPPGTLCHPEQSEGSPPTEMLRFAQHDGRHAISGIRPPPPAPPGTAHRVVFCTRCGGAMRVPVVTAGVPYACPNCYAALRVPA